MVCIGFPIQSHAYCKISSQEQEENSVVVKELVEKYGNEFGLGSIRKDQIVKTIKAESCFDFGAINPSDSHIGFDGSYGIAQFGIPTYMEFAPKIGINDSIDITDIKASRNEQIRVMVYMFSIGKQTRWTAWRKQFGDLKK